ncbi:hypothetical protein ABK040_002332 [Willaertia magna]
MKRRLLKVIEHDPETNEDEVEYRKILEEYQRKSREQEEGSFSEFTVELLEKIGLSSSFKPINLKYSVIYTKIKYSLFLAFGFIISLICQMNNKFFNSILKKLTGIYIGEEDTSFVIHMLAFSLTIFYFIQALISSPFLPISFRLKNRYQKKFFILFKIPLFLFCLILPFLFIPESIILLFSNISKYLIVVFFLFHTIFLIDFMYRWQKSWSQEDNWRFDAGLLSISFLFIVIGVISYFISFFNSGFKSTGCTINFYVTLFSSLISIILLIASLFVEHSSLFAGSFVLFYSSFSCLTILYSRPPLGGANGCNLNFSSTIMTLGFMLFSILSTLYSSIYAQSGFQYISQILWYGEEPETDEEHDFVSQEDELCHSYFFFHCFMTLSCCYMTTFFQQISGWTEFTLNSIYLILFTGLYGWSLMAPYILYWREFK